MDIIYHTNNNFNKAHRKYLNLKNKENNFYFQL